MLMLEGTDRSLGRSSTKKGAVYPTLWDIMAPMVTNVMTPKSTSLAPTFLVTLTPCVQFSGPYV